jgi:hypothetical protein
LAIIYFARMFFLQKIVRRAGQASKGLEY